MQDNIRMSLHGFRDENRDGLDDDHEPHAAVSYLGPSFELGVAKK
jgi:hypothetical protein